MKSSSKRLRISGVMAALFQRKALASVTAEHPRIRLALWDNWGTGTLRSLHPPQRHQINVTQDNFFFKHYGLTQEDLPRYLAGALSAGGDYADLYFEYLSSTSLTVDESMVKSASQGISAGCGVRVVSGERTGYAYTDDLSPERILHAARTAALIASGPAKTPVVGFQQKAARSLYPVTLPSVDAEITAKVELVMRIDAAARAYDPRIKEVRASYSDELRNILVVTSDGTIAEDSQPLARLNASCIAKTEQQSGRGSSGGGGRVALDFFFGEKTPEHFAKEAARQASCSWMRAKLRRARWKSCLVRDGRVCCCTKRSVTGWRRISIEKRPPRLRD